MNRLREMGATHSELPAIYIAGALKSLDSRMPM